MPTSYRGPYLGCVVNADTGKPVIVDEGRLTVADFEKVKISEIIEARGESSRRRLHSSMWQADPERIRRMAPIEFIGRYLREGLQTIDEDDDMLSAMARELVEEMESGRRLTPYGSPGTFTVSHVGCLGNKGGNLRPAMVFPSACGQVILDAIFSGMRSRRTVTTLSYSSQEPEGQGGSGSGWTLSVGASVYPEAVAGGIRLLTGGRLKVGSGNRMLDAGPSQRDRAFDAATHQLRPITGRATILASIFEVSFTALPHSSLVCDLVHFRALDLSFS